MNTHPAWQTLVDLIQQHWLSALFLLVTLTTLLVLISVRWWLRRRWKRFLEAEYEDEDAGLDALPPFDDRDRAVLDCIRGFRREVWQLPDAELVLSIEALSRRAVRIVGAVAEIYHPAKTVPQYEASLTELLQLVHRVSARLSRLGTIIPFKYVGNRRLSDFQRYYQVYRKINEHPVMQLLKRNPHLYRLARWAINLKNIANPLYWAGKEISRESYFYLLRWFYLAFTSQVGREAMRVYSGRQFQTEEEREAAVGCYRLVALAREWGGPSGHEWAVVVDFVTRHPAMEPEIKLQVLSRCSGNRLPGNLQDQRLCTGAGLKHYRRGLKLLQETDPESSPLKADLLAGELTAED